MESVGDGMKITIRLTIILLITISFVVPAAADAKGKKRLPRTIKSKYAAIVVDYPSNRIIHMENANAVRYPASLTKVMTLYLLFQALDNRELSLNQKLPVSKYAAKRAPTKLGLKPGQTITVKQAIYALVAKSANDVAAVVAEALAGTERAFGQLMTLQAKLLGMNSTVFYNASGLPHQQQKTTAADMAKLGVAMLKRFPHYYHYFQTQRFKYKERNYRSHNHLLRLYPGCDGMKTGYINASGFNVLTSAVRDGRRLVAVVMGGRSARSRDQHMTILLDRSFRKLGYITSRD